MKNWCLNNTFKLAELKLNIGNIPFLGLTKNKTCTLSVSYYDWISWYENMYVLFTIDEKYVYVCIVYASNILYNKTISGNTYAENYTV